MDIWSGLRISCCNPARYKYTPPLCSIKASSPVPVSSTKEYTPTPNSYTLESLQWAVPSEMSLTIKCLGANGDAE